MKFTSRSSCKATSGGLATKPRTLPLILIVIAACVAGVYAISAGWLPRYVEAPANGEVADWTPDANEPLRQEKPAPQANTPDANQPMPDAGESSGPPKRKKLEFAAIRFDYSELPDDARGTLTVRWYGKCRKGVRQLFVLNRADG